MTTLKRPGLVFTAEPLIRSVTSHYGSKYEEFPLRNETYIVCRDGTIQALNDPERCILWNIIEEEDRWTDEKGQPMMVSFVAWCSDVPDGHGSDSRNAFIIDFDDDEGEPEVQSPVNNTDLLIQKLKGTIYELDETQQKLIKGVIAGIGRPLSIEDTWKEFLAFFH